MRSAAIHTQPLVVVPYTATREGVTALALMANPPDEYASPVGIVYVNHN